MQFVNIFIIKFCLFCEANFHITFSPEREIQALNKECCKQQYVKPASSKHIFKKWGFVTSSNYLYCLLVIILNSWLKNCCYELKMQGFVLKKHVGFQQFFQQQFQFFHTQQLNLTGFLHHNQQRKKGLGFRWKNKVVENSLINSTEWNQEERVKKPSLEQVSVSRELQMCQESSWCSKIAKLAQAQLLQPLQTRSVQVPRLLHIFINQTKPTQSGFFLHFYAYRRPRIKEVHNWQKRNITVASPPENIQYLVLLKVQGCIVVSQLRKITAANWINK